MLSVTSDGTHLWGWFTAYDSAGRPVLFAAPSAVDLPSSLATIEQYGDLLHKVNGSYQFLNNAFGEIETMSYYASTTATFDPPPANELPPPILSTYTYEDDVVAGEKRVLYQRSRWLEEHCVVADGECEIASRSPITPPHYLIE